MTKKIILKLKSIKYSGSSIGDDIRLEISIFGELFSLKKKIKVGTGKEFNEVITELDTDRKTFEAGIDLRIVEDDPVFNDVGSLETEIKIDTTKNVQDFEYKIKVSELRPWLAKGTAIFVIILTAQILETETFIPETTDGWLKVEINKTGKKESLPSFLRVKILRSDSKRDYFNILEGFYKGKFASIKKKPGGLSYLERGFLKRKLVELLYSISKKNILFEGRKYNVDDDPNNLFDVGVYDIEIPDAPHDKGRKYLNRSKFALVWFHIGHNARDDRFLHTGSVSAGCVSMKEIEKWTAVCRKLLIARKGDDISIGTLKVVE